VGPRVLPRFGQLHPGYAVLLGAALVQSAHVQPAHAEPAQPAELSVTLRCEFTPAELQELDARVRLLVRGAPPPLPESVAVTCAGTSGNVTLHFADRDRSLPLPTEGAPVERVLRTVEQLLVEAPASEPHPSAADPALASDPEAAGAAPVETVDPEPFAADAPSPEAAPQSPKRSATIGGAGLGVSFEHWPDPAGFAVGPRLDFAWGKGAWAATSFESVRFGSTPDARLLAFDALLGVAWGAPFADTPAGAVLAFGGEWFSAAASSDPTGQRTSSSFILDLGLRWGATLGPGALWLGVDGRFRVRPPELPEPVSATLSRWSVIASVGGALTVR